VSWEFGRLGGIGRFNVRNSIDSVDNVRPDMLTAQQ
jgi:hypothetical protein